jgi:N-acetylglutamate synthase-like GNAT family acetyltransferase
MSDGTAARWRGMTLDDHPAVELVAERVHPDYPEDPGVFAERLRLYPDGCLVLDRGGMLLGYTIAHPWVFARPPGLNTMLGRLPEAPDTFYVHDLALLAQTRANGAGAAAVRLLADRARALGVATMALIAVGRSHGFWERQGFVVHDDAALRPKLASYGDSARFMMRTLG